MGRIPQQSHHELKWQRISVCVCNDNKWFELVNKNHQAQLMMQVHLIYLESVLYIDGTEHGIASVIIIEFG